SPAWRPKVADGWRERRPPEDGGGLLLDLGSHLVDQALQLFGPVRGLYAEVDARRPGAVADDDVFLALEHESGVHSHLWASTLAAEQAPRFRVLGDEAAYVKHGLEVQEEALRKGGSPTDADWGEEPPERWGRLIAGETQREVPTKRGSYGSFYAGVATSLHDGTPPPVDPRDAIA